QPGDGFRAHRLHAARAADRLLDRQRHQQLHLLSTSPGASVCTVAWGGTNSGNTSYLARTSTSTPYRASIPASTHTTTGKRRDQRTIAASTSVPAAGRSFHPQERCGAGGDDRSEEHTSELQSLA